MTRPFEDAAARSSVLHAGLAGLMIGFDNFGRAFALVTRVFIGELAARGLLPDRQRFFSPASSQR